MKLLIASDIHGSAYWCHRLMDLAETERPDRLLLLGDLLYHGPRNDLPRDYRPKEVISMLSTWKERILAVRGNCEAEVDQMVLPFPCMADYALLWTVFLYGHTHVKRDVTVGGVRCLNPGSVSIPKDGTNSCLICENGAFSFRILDKENRV